MTTLFATPEGLQRICESYSNIKIVVSEINEVTPVHFAQKYFGKNSLTNDFLYLDLLFQVLINSNNLSSIYSTVFSK